MPYPYFYGAVRCSFCKHGRRVAMPTRVMGTADTVSNDVGWAPLPRKRGRQEERVVFKCDERRMGRLRAIPLQPVSPSRMRRFGAPDSGQASSKNAAFQTDL